MDEPIYIIDHMIVMGIDPEKTHLTYSKIKNNEFSLDFLDIYPLKTNGEIPKYLDNFENWCFPEGFKIYDEKLRLLNENFYSSHGNSMTINSGLPSKRKYSSSEDHYLDISAKESMCHFVMTDEKYIKRYCTNLMIYEKLYIKHDENFKEKKKLSKLIPKLSISSIIRNPLILNDDADLIYVPKSIALISRIPFFDLQKNFLHYIYHHHIIEKRQKNEKLIQIPVFYFDQFDKIIKEEGLYQGEYDFKKQFNELVESNKNEKNNKYITIKETRIREFYISMIFSLLHIREDDCEISFLKLFKDNQNEELVRFRFNNGIGINLNNFSYKPLFTRLTLDNIIKIVKFILLEKQLLFFSSVPSEIPIITESLLSLISPLTWMNIYIPFLPIPMWETLHAIFPFIIGISKNYLKFILENLCVGDKILVDLDENTIYCDDEMQELLLPECFKDYIILKMSEIIQDHKKYNPNLKKDFKWEIMMLKTKQVFWNAMLSLLNNYEDFFRYEKNELDKSFNSGDIFDFDSYLNIFPSNELPFMDELTTKTMMFPKFIEETFKIANQKHFLDSPSLSVVIDDDNSLFFDQLYNLKSQFAIEKNEYINFNSHYEYFTYLEELQNDKIDQIIERCSSPEKINLLPFLIKFLKFNDFLKKTSKNNRETIVDSSVSNSNIQEKDNLITDKKNVKILDTNKINQWSQLFLKLDKKRIINLENIAQEIMMFYLENKKEEELENRTNENIFAPTLYDITFFNNLYHKDIYTDFDSPQISSIKKSKNLPKVITLTSNLENNAKNPSFVNNIKKNSFIDINNSHRSVNPKDLSKVSSAQLKPNEHFKYLDGEKDTPYQYSSNALKQDHENSESQINLKIINYESNNGLLNPSPLSSSTQLLQKINNFYIYYHTVKRNVNPSTHRRQYSKSIHITSSNKKINHLDMKTNNLYPPYSKPYQVLKKYSEESPFVNNSHTHDENTPIIEEKENEKDAMGDEMEKIDIKQIKRKYKMYASGKITSLMDFPTLNSNQRLEKIDKATFTNYMNFWSGKKNQKLTSIDFLKNFTLPYNLLEDKFSCKSLSPLKMEPNLTSESPTLLKLQGVKNDGTFIEGSHSPRSLAQMDQVDHIMISKDFLEGLEKSNYLENTPPKNIVESPQNTVVRKINSKKVSFFDQIPDKVKTQEENTNDGRSKLKKTKKLLSQDDILQQYIRDQEKSKRASSLEKKIRENNY